MDLDQRSPSLGCHVVWRSHPWRSLPCLGRLFQLIPGIAESFLRISWLRPWWHFFLLIRVIGQLNLPKLFPMVHQGLCLDLAGSFFLMYPFWLFGTYHNPWCIWWCLVLLWASSNRFWWGREYAWFLDVLWEDGCGFVVWFVLTVVGWVECRGVFSSESGHLSYTKGSLWF